MFNILSQKTNQCVVFTIDDTHKKLCLLLLLLVQNDLYYRNNYRMDKPLNFFISVKLLDLKSIAEQFKQITNLKVGCFTPRMPIYPALKHNKSNVCPLAIQGFKISKDNSFYLFFLKIVIYYFIQFWLYKTMLLFQKNIFLYFSYVVSRCKITRGKKKIFHPHPVYNNIFI